MKVCSIVVYYLRAICLTTNAVTVLQSPIPLAPRVDLGFTKLIVESYLHSVHYLSAINIRDTTCPLLLTSTIPVSLKLVVSTAKKKTQDFNNTSLGHDRKHCPVSRGTHALAFLHARLFDLGLSVLVDSNKIAEIGIKIRVITGTAHSLRVRDLTVASE